MKWVEELRGEVPDHVLEVIDYVWKWRKHFVRWPKQGRCFWPGCVRGKSQKHKYTPAQRARLKAAGIKVDGRENGPAVMAFLLEGGHRPYRLSSNRQWNIHHIYDGKFPARGRGRSVTTHAVRHRRLFTHSAGLVAVYPLADALADEVPYFAWLLRQEAYKRFKFDPDRVFVASRSAYVMSARTSCTALCAKTSCTTTWR